jgi:hypothetical protein
MFGLPNSNPTDHVQAYARMQYAVSIKHPGLDYTTDNGEYHIFQADRHVAEGLYHYPLRRPL